MIAVDKLIFNALASHSNVNMPGLGSLLSQRQPAKMKGRKTLTPPCNRVMFSYESLPLALNLVELIARQTGDEPGAREMYEAWLNHHGIRQGQELPSKITFEGVGEISGKTFTPSAELDKVLNPVGGRPIQLTPRVQAKQIGMIAGVVAVVIAGLFVYFHRSPEERRHAYQEQMAHDLERRNLERAQKGMEMVTADQAPPGLDGTDAAGAQPAKPEPAKTESAQSEPAKTGPAKTQAPTTSAATAQKPAGTAAEPTTQPTTETTQKPAASTSQSATTTTQKPAAATAQPSAQTASTPAATAAGPLYHVVFGVFSTRENADKFMHEFKAKDTSTAVSFSLVTMSGGKLLVSGFASADEKQADTKRRQYAAKYPGLWIYEQKK